MIGFVTKKTRQCERFRAALDRSLAIIEFDPTGRILDANENFCKALGYTRAEIVGKHHSMFIDPAEAQSQAYRDFWAKLGRGEYDAREYLRIARGGRDVYIQASYNPVLDARGRVERVVEFATDITARKLETAEAEAKLKAISLAQAVIEFTPTGDILDANDNFLRAMGYRLDEIKGRHHRMFVDSAYANSPDYPAFWAKLGRGEYVADGFERVGKGGKRVRLQASYNPIFDLRGRVAKVVKFATDISDLRELGGSLTKLAAGDVEHPIVNAFQPAFEPIRRDFNAAQEKLKSTLLTIADSADLVAASGKEVTSASEDLTRRTEAQAANLEETAAALGAVTETVKKTAESAGQASAVVSETRNDAERGGDVVRRAVEAMGRIEKSSQQISQIIGVIDEIAFQTNLLALNAGVEAARAGDAGRGFAVVASEVRALAQRSAEAAKEIKGLISASTEEVGEGVKLVAETGEALSRIIAKVAEINALIVDMARGAEEQSNSLHEVNAAVAQLDGGVQQNAAVAEESTAASRSLMAEADKLSRLASEFKLGRKAEKDALRGELARVAPHAFAQRASVPPPPPASGKRPAAAPAKAKRAATSGASSARNADWSEF